MEWIEMWHFEIDGNSNQQLIFWTIQVLWKQMNETEHVFDWTECPATPSKDPLSYLTVLTTCFNMALLQMKQAIAICRLELRQTTLSSLGGIGIGRCFFIRTTFVILTTILAVSLITTLWSLMCPDQSFCKFHTLFRHLCDIFHLQHVIVVQYFTFMSHWKTFANSYWLLNINIYMYMYTYALTILCEPFLKCITSAITLL